MRARGLLLLSFAFLSITIGACGSDAGPAGDPDLAVAGAVEDLSMPTPSPSPDLSAPPDLASTATTDMRSVGGDDGALPIGPAPDGGFCHLYGFGAPAVSVVKVTSQPASTGGTIPLGAYDAVEVTTTTNLTGTYRGTWVFASATEVHTYDGFASTGSTFPTPTPRTYAWSTSGVTLSRSLICPTGTTMPTGTYSVRTDASGTYLDVLSNGTLRVTFKKRP